MHDPDRRGRETEIKLLLDAPSDIDRLLAGLGPELPALHQHNVYYDGPARDWSRAGFAVRLREENHVHRLTVKSVGTVRGEFVERAEFERTIEPEVAWRFAPGGPMLGAAVSELLTDHGVVLDPEFHAIPLVPVGAMDNLRRRAPLEGEDSTWIVELDTTTYPDRSIVCEVELEIEGAEQADAASAALRAVFDRVGLAWRPSTMSKRERLERILRPAGV